MTLIFGIILCYNVKQTPSRETRDVLCPPPVWDLRAVILFPFFVFSLVLQPSVVVHSVSSFLW